ncbi:MAG: glycosyl transferase family 1 [Cyanobacteria bacterium RYN_339]|nr:glycosyl transferase family 1 [Cyanobacteria bacterium RYN_339]
MKPRVLMFGPDKLGGILSVERLILAHQQGCAIEMVTTAHDGPIWRTYGAFALALGRLLRPGGQELVHIHFSSKGSTLRKAILCAVARLTGRRVVLHAHGSGFREFYEALPRPAQAGFSWIFRGCAKFVALSGSWQAYYQTAFGLADRQMVVLRNPVDLPAAVPARTEAHELRIVFLGRIGERKGAFELIEAIAQLAPELRSRVRLDLAGDGDGERALAVAAACGLAAQVRVHAWLGVEERDALLAAAHLFALPSRNEGLPMSMLEAMGWGLPVLVTPVGGIPELVRHGENGWLVPPGDVDALAAACATLLGDEALRDALGAAGRRSVEELGIGAYVESLTAVYAAALAEVA